MHTKWCIYVFVGSISDVELTKVSGYVDTLEGKEGVSVMADRGFTIWDLLSKKNIELNIPPFMEGRKQLAAKKVQSGRNIASLRIHVERAIGRIKKLFDFEVHTSYYNDQIGKSCAWLTNFQPVLVPLPSDCCTEDEVQSYFNSIEDSDYDADSEMSDQCDS